MQEMWQVRNMPGHVIDITPSNVGDSWLLTVNLDDIDSAIGHCKGIEIEIASWLSDNADKNTRYVVMDDEYVILDSQLPHLLKGQVEGRITACLLR